MHLHTIRLWALAGLGLILSGCGKGGVAAVEGVVTLDGAPLAGATVVFVPEGGTGVGGSAVTNAQGMFKVTAPSGTSALPAGTYKVTVAKEEAVAISYSEDASKNPTLAMQETIKAAKEDTSKKGMMGQVSLPKGKSLVPGKYTNPKTTPFTVTVPPPDRQVKLEVVSKG